MKDPAVILLGAGGHAKVVLDLLRARGETVLGVCDPDLAAGGVDRWRDLAVLGDDEAILRHPPDEVRLVAGLGQAPGSDRRAELHRRFIQAGYRFAALAHPSAILGSGLSLAAGAQLMAGVIAQADVTVGEDSIVNTGVRLDHDVRLGRHAHIAPGAILAGEVTVGDGCFVGPGAVIGRGVTLGEGAVIGAGASVVRPVPAHHRLLGPAMPAATLSRRS